MWNFNISCKIIFYYYYSSKSDLYIKKSVNINGRTSEPQKLIFGTSHEFSLKIL